MYYAQHNYFIMGGSIYDDSLNFQTGATYIDDEKELMHCDYLLMNSNYQYIGVNSRSIVTLQDREISNALFIDNYTRHGLYALSALLTPLIVFEGMNSKKDRKAQNSEI